MQGKVADVMTLQAKAWVLIVHPCAVDSILSVSAQQSTSSRGHGRAPVKCGQSPHTEMQLLSSAAGVK